MLFLIYFFYFNIIDAYKCSLKTPMISEHVYLCRERLNSSSIRIWLHFKFNQSELQDSVFKYYSFTLRTIDLLNEHEVHLEDRFEKQIGNYMEINTKQNENNTINIYNLPSGRYEICVNLLNKKKTFYYRSPNSCLQVPWNVPEHEQDKPNRLVHVLLLISIIILLVAIAFVIYAIHQYVKSKRAPVVTHNIDEVQETDEDSHNSERAKFLVRQHFVQDINPFELLVKRRIYQRYGHWSPDLNES